MTPTNRLGRAVVAGLGLASLAATLGMAAPHAMAATHAPVSSAGHAAMATPPPPLTRRYIVSAGGTANLMDNNRNPATGTNIEFSGSGGSGGYEDSWYFDLKSGGYEIHPLDNTGVCVTLSTTQLGVSKAESCSQAPNQVFDDIAVGSGDYQIYNRSLGVYLNDPHTGSTSQHIAGTIRTCPVIVTSGCIFSQF